MSVIIPVYNDSDSLHRCLTGLTTSSRAPDEIIVVDDASTDESRNTALQFNTRVISIDETSKGPAFARNRGAEAAIGDILIFIDSDVVVHIDTLNKIEEYLNNEQNVAALFGSYDEDPSARGFITRYKNLFHHYVHQQGNKEASTFWAGCGAVRKKIFSQMGGFSENYTRPMIEDIELGIRMRNAGYRIWLCNDVQVTHLKRWTLMSMIRSDIFDRAVPWTLLIMHNRQLPSDLNLRINQRLSALSAWLTVACLVIGFWVNWIWIGVLVIFIIQYLLNNDLYSFFFKKGSGLLFTVKAIVMHYIYLLYSSFIFGATGILTGFIINKRK